MHGGRGGCECVLRDMESFLNHVHFNPSLIKKLDLDPIIVFLTHLVKAISFLLSLASSALRIVNLLAITSQ